MSAFAARVRVSIRAKELPIRILNDPDVGSERFGELNPLRRVPVLVLDDGSAIPESETIVEYLEDIYPHTPLRPADPLARARVRLISRVAELYVFPAALPIFGVLAASNVDQRDNLFEKLDSALRSLVSLLGHANESWHAFGDALTTADGALAPFLFYIDFVGSRTRCSRRSLLKSRLLGALRDTGQAPKYREAVAAGCIPALLRGSQFTASVRQAAD
jgi:glutathione S-transferase